MKSYRMLACSAIVASLIPAAFASHSDGFLEAKAANETRDCWSGVFEVKRADLVFTQFESGTCADNSAHTTVYVGETGANCGEEFCPTVAALRILATVEFCGDTVDTSSCECADVYYINTDPDQCQYYNVACIQGLEFIIDACGCYCG